MKDIRFDGKLEYRIDDVGFVNLSRDEDHTFEYKTGKELYSFIYVESGELDYCFLKSKRSIRLEKGALLFVPKHYPYKTRYLKDGTKIKTIIFDIPDSPVPEELGEPFLKTSPVISDLFRSVSGENGNRVLFLSAKIYELLDLVQNDLSPTPKKFRKLLPSLREMQENYFESKKISAYAETCGMSESHFRKLFREYTGISPVEYRNRLRISQAKKMIQSGEFSVGEAAYLAGFNNMSFFYQVYNKSKK